MKAKKTTAPRQLRLVDQRKGDWLCVWCLNISSAKDECGRCGAPRWTSRQMRRALEAG